MQLASHEDATLQGDAVDEARLVGSQALEGCEQNETGLLVLVATHGGGVAAVASRLVVGGDGVASALISHTHASGWNTAHEPASGVEAELRGGAGASLET